MKKLVTLLLAAGMVFSAANPASATDFKPFGSAEFVFDFLGNFGSFEPAVVNSFMDSSDARHNLNETYNPKHNRFVQRFILGFDAAVSERLSAHFDVIAGFNTWGGPAPAGAAGVATGGAFGTRASNIVVRQAYLDWLIPSTAIKVRMGQQAWSIPRFATGTPNPFADEFGTGIQISGAIGQNVNFNLGWLRADSESRRGNAAALVNETSDINDVFSLTVPIKFDGFRVMPWAAVGFFGQEAVFGNASYSGAAIKMGPTFWAANEGNLAAGGTSYGTLATPAAATAAINAMLRDRGNVNPWWAGLSFEMTKFSPFRLGIDFAYSAVSTDHDYLDRSGWSVSAALDYTTKYGVPGLRGWYSTGDDSHFENGSERPIGSGGGGTTLAPAFFYTGNQMLSPLGGTAAGTWGISLQWNKVSFMKDLYHNFRVTYIGGTNSGAMSRYATAKNITSYMTTHDNVVEFDIESVYNIYQNLAVMLELSYILEDLSGSTWGKSVGSVTPRMEFSDAWRVALAFRYSF